MNKNGRTKNWIALYTKARHEKVVASELEKKGFEIYLPILRERRKWSDRKKWVELPMFKSYLFVKITNNDRISLANTPGLVKVVMFGGKTAIVRESSIDAIKLMLSGGYNPIPTNYFLKGDPVLVESGPLKGLSGEVIRIDNNDRLIVRIDAIKHSISIDIERRFLKLLT